MLHVLGLLASLFAAVSLYFTFVYPVDNLFVLLGVFDIARPWETFTKRKLQCGLKFLSLRFDAYDFERYSDVFRDDSIMILAQAGEYYKADGIEGT